MIECITRAAMPQIDDKDIPALLDFMSARGIPHVKHLVRPDILRMEQRIVPAKVKGIIRSHLDLLAKPPLVSGDLIVIDGNHRVAAARVSHAHLNVITFDLDFAAILPHIYAFPGTYEYGDGKGHTVHN